MLKVRSTDHFIDGNSRKTGMFLLVSMCLMPVYLLIKLVK